MMRYTTTGFTVWLTGMSGAGKSTLANYLGQRLRAIGRRVEVLDQAELQERFAPGDGVSKDERNLLVRRMGYLAQLLTRNDAVVLCAATSPYRDARDELRRDIGRFVEVFCDCSTEKLIERDTTGQYKKAIAGQLPNFIGISDPYETPARAEATIYSDVESVEQSATKILQTLVDIGYLKPEDTKAMTGKRFRPATAKERAKAKAADAAAAQVRAAAKARASSTAGGQGAKQVQEDAPPAKAAKASGKVAQREAKAVQPEAKAGKGAAKPKSGPESKAGKKAAAPEAKAGKKAAKPAKPAAKAGQPAAKAKPAPKGKAAVQPAPKAAARPARTTAPAKVAGTHPAKRGDKQAKVAAKAGRR